MFSSHPIMEEYWVWYTVGQLMHATLLLMGFQPRGFMFNAFTSRIFADHFQLG